MREYKVVDVSEKQLEELVRKHPDLIEEGLRFLDHQVQTERGPLDVLLANRENALVVAELKVVEDDGMLVQGIDYYDYVASNIHAFARGYKDGNIHPEQDLRLFLIAPSFSALLLNRCKWIDVPLSVFTYQCLVFHDEPKGIVPVFSEVTVPTRAPTVEFPTVEEHLKYITDDEVRAIAEELLFSEVEAWDKENILIEARKYYVVARAFGEALMYLWTRRKSFWVSTTDENEQWWQFKVQKREDKDLQEARSLIRSNYEKFKKSVS